MSIRRIAALTLFLLVVSAVVGWGALYTVVDFTFVLFGAIGYGVAALTVIWWGFVERVNKGAIGTVAGLAVLLAAVWIVLALTIG